MSGRGPSAKSPHVTEPLQKPAPLAPLAVFLVFPVIAYIVGTIAMPHPTSVTESRVSTDRNKLEGEVLLKSPPNPRFPVNANFDGKIAVLGMDLEKERTGVGTRNVVTIYYRAESEMQEAWKIFMHVDSQTAQYRIHGDHFPPEGYSTDKWRKGDIIADRYALSIPLDAHKGAYTMWMGFYDPADDDARLKLTPGQNVQTDGANRVKLGVMVVE